MANQIHFGAKKQGETAKEKLALWLERLAKKLK